MKRAAIILAVTALHVAVLSWFLSRSDSSGNRAAAPTPSETPPGVQESGMQPETQNAQTGDAEPPPTPTRLHNAARRLPPALTANEQHCTAGILVDWTQRRILWAKAPDTPVPIASMTKMMTALLLIEAVRQDPMIELNTPVRATRTAARIGGRQVYLDFRETFTVDELLKCMMIFSANDIAYLTAEFLAGGNVDLFVRRMNERAAELGMTKTRFRTPNGLPPRDGAPDIGTARDMAVLAAEVLHYPEVTKWASTWLAYIREDSERFDRFQLVNTNRLIRESPGVNGMKTGYTGAAGFCLAATCERNDRVLIGVVTGFPSAGERNAFVKQLLDWGYDQ